MICGSIHQVQRMRCKFEELLQKFGQDEIPETQIIENIMKDTVHADRTMLPITGCDPDWEYELSPIFIETESDRVILSCNPIYSSISVEFAICTV